MATNMKIMTVDDLKDAIIQYESNNGPMDAPLYIDGHVLDGKLPVYFHGTGGPDAECTCEFSDGMHVWSNRIKFIADTGESPEQLERQDINSQNIEDIFNMQEGDPRLN